MRNALNNNNNINIKGFSKTHNNNNNIESNREKSKQVEIIADELVTRFNNPSYKKFYCKVAWALPESRIWQHYESAIAGDNPGRLFSYLCKRDGV